MWDMHGMGWGMGLLYLLVILLSILGTFIIMNHTGINSNIMSLGGSMLVLVFVMGVVVHGLSLDYVLCKGYYPKH